MNPATCCTFFGFSRGAFTARSLAGLIRNSGILRRENVGRIDQAWVLYRSSADTPRGVAATLFRRAYSFEPRIQFIGVWDTVGALGIPTFGPGESIDFKVEPNPLTSPHRSWTKFYRLVSPLNRPIGTAEDETDHHLDGCEYLAVSAKEHYEATPDYRPPELVTYLSDPANVHLDPVPEKA